MDTPFAGVDWSRWEMHVRVDSIRKVANTSSEAMLLLLPPKNLPVGHSYWIEVQWRKKRSAAA